MLYHYPKTARPATRDANEVEATKNAGRLGKCEHMSWQEALQTRGNCRIFDRLLYCGEKY
jgi:hypothetical protein